jgi:hypothetical protein
LYLIPSLKKEERIRGRAFYLGIHHIPEDPIIKKTHHGKKVDIF